MLLTLAMVDTRSMIQVVLIVISRVDSVVHVCEETHFVSQRVVQRVLTFSFSRKLVFYRLSSRCAAKTSALKLILAKNFYRVLHGVFRE